MPQYYTGIGSRETPQWILVYIKEIAAWLNERGWVLRSGHTDGADLAFEQGAASWGSEIYLPCEIFNNRIDVYGQSFWNQTEWASNFDWLLGNRYLAGIPLERLFITTRLRYGRNVAQVVGCRETGYHNSSFVIGWWPIDNNRNVQGGTRIAVNLAKSLGIKTYNLADSSDFNRVKSKLDSDGYHPRYRQVIDGFERAGSAIDPNSIRRDG